MKFLSTPQTLDDSALASGHRLPAVRGHLYQLLGDLGAARRQYLLAAQ